MAVSFEHKMFGEKVRIGFKKLDVKVKQVSIKIILVKQDRFKTCFNDLWNRFIILEGV